MSTEILNLLTLATRTTDPEELREIADQLDELGQNEAANIVRTRADEREAEQ